MNRETLRRILPFVILTVVFAALLYRAEHKAETGISRVDRHITEVTSPCLRYGPSSRQCKRSFEAAVATINHAEACAILRKAGLRVASCRGARLAQEVERSKERAARESASGPPPSGGDATSSPHTGSSQPGFHGGEGGSEHGSGGSHEAPAPGNGGSGGAPVPGKHGGGGEQVPPPTSSPPEGSPGSSSPPTIEAHEPAVETPAPEEPVAKGLGGVLEGVGKTLEAAGGAVEEAGNGVSETVHETQCSLGIGQC